MKKIHGENQEEKGVVLVISLLVTVVLLIVITPFLFKLSGEYRNTDKTFKFLAALHLAGRQCRAYTDTVIRANVRRRYGGGYRHQYFKSRKKQPGSGIYR